MRLTDQEMKNIANHYKNQKSVKEIKDVQYPGRRKNLDDSRNYAANNKIAQKAIRNVYGLKK